ncbi:MAG: hypothetical protein WBY53_16155, partial [Acidobacteriaceae bacterium]
MELLLLAGRMPVEAAMNVARTLRFSFLMTIAVLSAGAWVALAGAQVQMHVQDPSSVHPKELYPQIVRLSLVEGDVRVAVGKAKGLKDMAPWVDGTVNMPLQTGFTVVTGKGQVEIEFEDASTMYLGNDSALAFDTLTTKDGVPNTEMTLLTGVAVLNLHPNVLRESYYLATPNDFIRVLPGHTASLRINAYTDTTTITPLSFGKEHPGGSLSPLLGHTYTFGDGFLEATAAGPEHASNAVFQAWAIKRVEERSAALHQVMKDAGLKEPLPGLADMEAKGVFFNCKPYGTCWEPTNGWGGEHATAKGGLLRVSAKIAGADKQGAAAEMPGQSMQEQAIQGQSAQAESPQTPAPTAEQMKDATLAREAVSDELMAEQETSGGAAPVPVWGEDYDFFPCSPYGFDDMMDPMAGPIAMDLGWEDGFDDAGYDWAVCHAGDWIWWGGRYAWVAGRNHHHRCPLRWVKVGKRLGYVPLHPRDKEGEEPRNLRHGVFMRTDRKGGGAVRRGGGIERVAYHSGTEVKLLGETPREFREPALQRMHAASAPTLEAHRLMGVTEGGKVIARSSVMAFDSRAKGFTVSTRMGEGGQSRMVVDHFTGGAGRGFSGGGSGSGHFGGGGGHF